MNLIYLLSNILFVRVSSFDYFNETFNFIKNKEEIEKT